MVPGDAVAPGADTDAHSIPRGALPPAPPAEPVGSDSTPAGDSLRSTSEIEEVIRAFLSAYRADGRGNSGRLAESRNLWREVSSLTLLQLVAFVEQRFALKVRPIDFAPQNFATVSAIARFVAARLAPVSR